MVFGMKDRDYGSLWGARSLAEASFVNYMIENPQWTIKNRGKFVGIMFDNEGKLVSSDIWAKRVYSSREDAFPDIVRSNLDSREKGNVYFDRIGFFAGENDITEKLLSGVV